MRDESSSGRMEKPAYAVGPPSWRFSTAFLAGRSFCKKFALLRKIFHLERQFPSLGAQIYGPIVHILLICLSSGGIRFECVTWHRSCLPVRWNQYSGPNWRVGLLGLVVSTGVTGTALPSVSLNRYVPGRRVVPDVELKYDSL